MKNRRLAVLVYLGIAALCAVSMACGDVQSASDGGPGRSDAGPVADGGVGLADAGEVAPDAGMPVAAPPSTDLTSGGTRVSGATYHMDVELGQAFSQAPVSGSSTNTTSAAAVAR